MDDPHVYNRNGCSPCVKYGWMVPMCTIGMDGPTCKIGMDGPHVYNRDGWMDGPHVHNRDGWFPFI